MLSLSPSQALVFSVSRKFILCISKGFWGERRLSKKAQNSRLYLCISLCFLIVFLLQLQQKGEKYNTLGLGKVIIGKGLSSLFLSSAVPSVPPGVFLETALARTVPQLLYYLAILTVCFLAHTICVVMFSVHLFQENAFLSSSLGAEPEPNVFLLSGLISVQAAVKE